MKNFKVLLLYLLLLIHQGLLAQNGYYTNYEEALLNPADVETLDISGKEVDNQLYRFINIRTLILREGTLETVNAKVANLIYLKEIIIVSSNLKYVSPELFSLPNLQHVNLSGNMLTDITFVYNHSIEVLNLAYNDLTQIDSIHLLDHLNHLNVSGNALRSFSPHGSFWGTLESLDLSNNDISYIDTAIHRAESIQYLNLRHNRLPAFPKALHTKTKLERLDLAGNLITDIPNDWLKAISLYRLDISGNPIKCDSVVQFDQLKFLARSKCLCSGCQFQSQYPSFSTYPDD